MTDATQWAGVDGTLAHGSWRDYVSIARPDHWFKNVFMLPGSALAVMLTDVTAAQAVLPTIIGFCSLCLLASSNYVINEWLDAEFDKHHPVKKNRSTVVGNVQGLFVIIEYVLLAASGLALATRLSSHFLIFAVVFLAMGLVYNVRPFRTKDRVYLDVVSEAFNNPLRLVLGWTAAASGGPSAPTLLLALPPGSVLLSYWAGGAFLMTVKRFAEYRFIGDSVRAGLYRKSFRHYTENRLLLASFFYALSSLFFLGVFMVKYRIEFLLAVPLLALLFVWYLGIGLKRRSATQNPEKLYREVGFVAYVILVCVVIGLLFVVDLPWLHSLVQQVEYRTPR